jgi:hypothetical protein
VQLCAAILCSKIQIPSWYTPFFSSFGKLQEKKKENCKSYYHNDHNNSAYSQCGHCILLCCTAPSQQHSKPLEPLFRHFDGVVDKWIGVNSLWLESPVAEAMKQAASFQVS